VAALHTYWLRRQPVVVELAVPLAELRAPEADDREPWEVGEGFEFTRERLQFLVWANNWDARSGEPVWWWARKAARLGAVAGGPADVLVDGHPVWVDGGPRQALDAPVVSRESVDAGALRLAPSARAPTAALAPDQLAAVAHAVGPARVIAPAGSGKTRVLSERLGHLLQDRGWEHSTVTAVAFNKRAADELVARTSRAAHVRTIHALGLSVLTGSLHGAARRLDVLDERQVRRVLEGLLELRPQANTDVLAPYLQGLSAIRIGLQSPAEAERLFPDADGLTALWPRYRDALDRAGAIDFDDQVSGAIRLLLRDPGARAAAQARCQHLLVDEFQDLAPAHLLLLRLLSAPGYDVFGVGDDDQVIYGYAGATPRYLIDFEAWFPGAVPYALEVNYRCPTAIVSAATRLLSYNAERITKTVRARPGAPAGEVDVRSVPPERMAHEAVDAVRDALGAGAAPRDIAVLARVNARLLPVQIALSEAGVPTNLPLDTRVLERTGVRAALAWLRVGVDPSHITRADLAETIRRPSRRVSRNVVEMLTKRAATSVADVRRLAGRLSGGDVAKLEEYAYDVEAVARAATRSTAAALAAIASTVGLGTAMDALDAGRAEADRSSHRDDLKALQQVATFHPEAATFGEWLRVVLTPRPVHEGAVTLSTVHRVKGQEWPIVVVFGVDEEVFPHRLATDVEEERRVFHVAVTRASERVVVIADASSPSPFVTELDGSRPHAPLRGRSDVAAKARQVAEAAGGARGTGARGTGARPAPGGAVGGAAAGGRAVTRPEDEELFQALRAWRRDTAERSKLPAFVVLSDASLRDVAARRPGTLAQLRQCHGIGPAKLERYGDELLAVIERRGALPSAHGKGG
jgi:DNA helicase-2/ATP-dependent DNA helicase PcrA